MLNRYYIGSTEDIVSRLESHLKNHKGFTSRAKDWQLCYQESLETRVGAVRREMEIKRWKSRVMIENLINKGD